jgi:hypothetical protein
LTLAKLPVAKSALARDKRFTYSSQQLHLSQVLQLIIKEYRVCAAAAAAWFHFSQCISRADEIFCGGDGPAAEQRKLIIASGARVQHMLSAKPTEKVLTFAANKKAVTRIPQLCRITPWSSAMLLPEQHASITSRVIGGSISPVWRRMRQML